MTDCDYWRPALRAICARHHLPFDERVEAGQEGTNAVFLTGDLAVKIYAAPAPPWYARERECLRVLSAVPAAKAPRLLASGPAANGDANHPYLVTARLPGVCLSEVWEGLSREARCLVARQAAVMLSALHATPVDGLRAFETAPAVWAGRMRARAALCEEYLRRGGHLPPHLLGQVGGFLEENLDCLLEDFKPRLLSGDVHGDHLLVEERGGAWQVSGHIDFGDAEVGPVEYEWVALCLDAFRGDAAAIDAFFAEYGGPSPREGATRQRLKLYTLLHRFANPGWLAHIAGKPADAPDLDIFLDSLWPI